MLGNRNSFGGHSRKPRSARNSRRRSASNAYRAATLGMEALEARCMLSINPVVSIPNNQFFGAGSDNHTLVPFRVSFTDVAEASPQDFSYMIKWDVDHPLANDVTTGTPIAVPFPQSYSLDTGYVYAPGDPILGGIEEHSHFYATPGDYNVQVTISDSLGGSTMATTQVHVYAPDAGLKIGDGINQEEIVPEPLPAAETEEGAEFTLNLSSTDSSLTNVTLWTINWGDTIQTIAGNPSSVTHIYSNDYDRYILSPLHEFGIPDAYFVSAVATGDNGTHLSTFEPVRVLDVLPTVTATPPTTVGKDVPFALDLHVDDPGTDDVQFWVIAWDIDGPADLSNFSILPGNATSATHTYTTAGTHRAFVSAADEDQFGGGFTTLDINVENLANISGVVFVDVNHNGLFDSNEPGIDGVTIKLLHTDGTPVLDGNGHAITSVTSSGGLYLFTSLQPGTYDVFEQQPTGVTDGAEQLGTLGGTVVANDRMRITLGTADAFDYAFAEIGQTLKSDDTAGIGFWQNKTGQALLAQGGTQLAAWLTSHFGNVFGNSLFGMTGAQVASFYRDQVFKGMAKGGTPKVDAQFMATAFSTYFTSKALAGQVALAYGFTVTDTGIGTKIVNVGTKGAAFGVANGTNRTIMELLSATNNLTDQSNASAGYVAVYDTNGNGVISAAESNLRSLASDLYSSINLAGGI
jgi:hypothetical protein